MKYRLIIAEKPSVGVSIGKVLGAKERREGYLEGNGYLISWCYGHIAELSTPEAYDERYAKWAYADLPIIPETWVYKVSRNKHKQFEILKGLMLRNDVTEVINACDAGREGELIFRNVYNLAGCDKPILRLWISSMEDKAIRAGFDHLRPGSDYDNLYAAALCRAKADWLVGINASRLFSVTYHRPLNVGRVVSPTLALLVQREAEIEAFVPEGFYKVTLDCGDFSAVSDRIKDQETANQIAAACKGMTGIVDRVEQSERTVKPPQLFDLTALQKEANAAFGFTAQQTLDYVQSLYEKKLCSYPRTDAQFLTDDMLGRVPALLESAAVILNMPVEVPFSAAQICNSEKVSDHHSLVPTAYAAKAPLDTLPAGERNILALIARQLFCAVSEPFRYAETVTTLNCEGFLFTAKGKAVQQLGWMAYMDKAAMGKPMPSVAEQESIPVKEVHVTEGQTAPPKHFTEGGLLSAMETAGAMEAPEDAERRGLGTPATRAGIIEKLITAGYVYRKKAQKTVSLIPVQAGTSLITVLPEQLQSPLLTAEWEHRLKQVEHGELSPESFMAGIEEMVRELVKTHTMIPGAEILFPSGREVVGQCPRCGGDVTESKEGFFCESYNCRFGLWRDNHFLVGKHIDLTKPMAAALLAQKRVPVTGIYSERTGKTYDADLLLEDNGERTIYRLDFRKDDNK